jgi:hypothetical protein
MRSLRDHGKDHGLPELAGTCFRFGWEFELSAVEDCRRDAAIGPGTGAGPMFATSMPGTAR